MKKVSLRLISLLLIPFLTVDPTLAAILNPLHYPLHSKLNGNIAASLFVRQALSPRDLSVQRGMPRPVRVSFAELGLENDYLALPVAGVTPENKDAERRAAKEDVASGRLKKLRPKTFGQLIRQLRDDAQMSQEELAFKAKISVRAVSRVENDSFVPLHSTVSNLCSVFRLNVQEIERKFLWQLRNNKNASRADRMGGDLMASTPKEDLIREIEPITIAVPKQLAKEFRAARLLAGSSIDEVILETIRHVVDQVKQKITGRDPALNEVKEVAPARPDDSGVAGIVTGGLAAPLVRVYDRLRDWGWPEGVIQVIVAPVLQAIYFKGIFFGLPLSLAMTNGWILNHLPMILLTSAIVNMFVYGSKLTHPYVYVGDQKRKAGFKDWSWLFVRDLIENCLMLGFLFLAAMAAINAADPTGMGITPYPPPPSPAFFISAGLAVGALADAITHSVLNGISRLGARRFGWISGTATGGSGESQTYTFKLKFLYSRESEGMIGREVATWPGKPRAGEYQTPGFAEYRLDLSDPATREILQMLPEEYWPANEGGLRFVVTQKKTDANPKPVAIVSQYSDQDQFIVVLGGQQLMIDYQSHLATGRTTPWIIHVANLQASLRPELSITGDQIHLVLHRRASDTDAEDVTHRPGLHWARRLSDAASLAPGAGQWKKRIREALSVIWPDGEGGEPAAMGRLRDGQVALDARVIRAYTFLIWIASNQHNLPEGEGSKSLEKIRRMLVEDTVYHELTEEALRTVAAPTVRIAIQNAARPYGLSLDQAFHLISQLLDDRGRALWFDGWLVDLDPEDKATAQILLDALPLGHPVLEAAKDYLARARQIAFLTEALKTKEIRLYPEKKATNWWLRHQKDAPPQPIELRAAKPTPRSSYSINAWLKDAREYWPQRWGGWGINRWLRDRKDAPMPGWGSADSTYGYNWSNMGNAWLKDQRDHTLKPRGTNWWLRDRKNRPHLSYVEHPAWSELENTAYEGPWLKDSRDHKLSRWGVNWWLRERKDRPGLSYMEHPYWSEPDRSGEGPWLQDSRDHFITPSGVNPWLRDRKNAPPQFADTTSHIEKPGDMENGESLREGRITERTLNAKGQNWWLKNRTALYYTTGGVFLIVVLAAIVHSAARVSLGDQTGAIQDLASVFSVVTIGVPLTGRGEQFFLQISQKVLSMLSKPLDSGLRYSHLHDTSA